MTDSTENRENPSILSIEEDGEGFTSMQPDQEDQAPTASLQALGVGASTGNQPLTDLTSWAERHCRQFLLENIQHQTEQYVRTLTVSSAELKQNLVQKMAERGRKERNRYLTVETQKGNLSQSAWIYARADVDSDSVSTSRASMSSQTSVNSLSSQMSDSLLNDVEQSANILLQKLRMGAKRVKSIEGSSLKHSILSLVKKQSPRFPDRNIAASLGNAIADAQSIIRNYQGEMGSTGFTDVGLKLNAYARTFEDTVLKYLETVEKKGKHIKKLRKALNFPEEWEHWHEDYPSFISATKNIAADVEQALQSAIEARDAYLKAAYPVMPEVIQTYAESYGFRIQYNDDGVVFYQLEVN